jgi:hypothetical protein
MKHMEIYVMDLSKIEGSGDFSCPGCGASISPDDCTDKAYSIIETKVNKQGLEELVIRCNRCASYLHLIGFSLLEKLAETDAEKLDEKREEARCYITHL